jgi:hypothetical protein
MRTRKKISTAGDAMAKQALLRSTELLLIFAASIAVGQRAAKRSLPFRPADYPRSEFRVTQSLHSLGAVNIQIIQAERREPGAHAPGYCRAWVKISRGEIAASSVFYDYNDLEPVGYSYGVFVPQKQPSPDYFVVVKEGDYNGRLLLVDGSGRVTDILGGSFFIASARFLVSEYASDSSGLAVFDLMAHKLLMQSTDVPYVQNWYRDSKGYFFTESEWSGASGRPHEKPGVACRLELEKGQIAKIDISPPTLKSARRITEDFDPTQYADCTAK